MKLRMLRMEEREKGREEGEKLGINKITQLMQKLIADGKKDELEAIATDANLRAELFKQYGIV